MQIDDVRGVLRRIEMRLVEINMPKQVFYEKSGISSGSFSQWNTGTHTPSLKKLKTAADVLGVSLEYLLTGKDSDEETKKGAEKAPDPKIEGELIAALPEDIQQLIQICRSNPGIASALIAVARQIEKGQAAQG